MSYTQPFVLTTVEGNFGASPVHEQWRATWKIPVEPGDVPPGLDVLAYLTAIAPVVSTFHGMMSAGVVSQLVSLAGAVIGTDGKYLGGGAQETQRYTYPSSIGGLGTTLHPFDAANVVSLRTTNARGRASRGRFYWPAVGAAVGSSDGLQSLSIVESFADAAKELIDNVNDTAALYLGPLCSVAVMSSLGAGTTATVSSVSVGRKIDHMSSRTAKLSEGHVWVDLDSTVFAVNAAREAHEKIIRDAAMSTSAS